MDMPSSNSSIASSSTPGHVMLGPISAAPLDAPADCTLACEEGHLQAHKIVLCAHSKYLQDILSKFPNAEHPIIILTELNITDIKILVNYMYTGDLVLTNDGSAASLLRAAQILKIDSLTDFDEDDDGIHEDVDDEDMVDTVSHHHHEDALTDRDDDVDDDVVEVDTRRVNHHLSSSRHNQHDLQQQHSRHQSMSIQHNNSISKKHRHTNGSNNNNNTSSNNNNHPHNHPLHHHNQHHLPHDGLGSPNSKDSNNSNNKIRCHLCNIGLSDVKCLYRHVLTRHLPEKWGYKCEFCDREFSRDDHLMRHYTTKHKNMEFNREKIRETRRLNREMAKNFHDQISKFEV